MRASGTAREMRRACEPLNGRLRSRGVLSERTIAKQKACIFALACAAVFAFAGHPLPAPASPSKIPAAARTTLDRYLGALSKKQYASAFAVLADKDRAYFRSADNFASIFAVDEFRLDSYKVVGSRSGGTLGLVALV